MLTFLCSLLPGVPIKQKLPREKARQGRLPTRHTCTHAHKQSILPGLDGHSLTWRLQKALQTFFALGPQTADRLLAKYSIFPHQRIGTISPKTVLQLNAELSVLTIDNDAKKAVQDNIQRLREMGTYRGRRHAVGLPVRGQRTRNQTSTPNKLNRLERFGRW